MKLSSGAIAKWLRRQIRNLFSFGGAGSNPAGVDCEFFYQILKDNSYLLVHVVFLRGESRHVASYACVALVPNHHLPRQVHRHPAA